MDKFYDGINGSACESLLTATPFKQELRERFGNNLTEELFFKKLYTERSRDPNYEEENSRFEEKIKRAWSETENRYSKVSMLHIAGYAGCGKTTFIHHLLLEQHMEPEEYEVIDYESCTYASEPFKYRIAASLFSIQEKQSLLEYFIEVANERLFFLNRFYDQAPALKKLSEMIQGEKKPDTKMAYISLLDRFENECLSQAENRKKGKEDFLSFLLFLELILLVYGRLTRKNLRPMVLLIDNADSLSDLSEEAVLHAAIYEFENDCNYFFAWNNDNDTVYRNMCVADALKETKWILIFTTRIATSRRYASLKPDWEKINGWISVEFPPNYYEHQEIISHRIQYYLSVEEEDSEISKELRRIGSLSEIAYQNYNFKRLFNGNYRCCVEKICQIVNTIPERQIKELERLFEEKSDSKDAAEGANAYFLYLILSVFKTNGIYKNTLNLNPIRRTGKVSLSRMILTILREKGDRCSLLDVLELLTPVGYEPEAICRQVWNLCEVSRRYGWRRLLTFDVIVPADYDALKDEADKYKSGNRTFTDYSELVICTAGQAYMEFVIPHFEFMLSRHETAPGQNATMMKLPLFDSSSEHNISKQPRVVRYRFEEKIENVYKDVVCCCNNSVLFADAVQKQFHIHDRGFYINNTYYNYHPVGWDHDVGPKQSYESRLIYRHVSYIEKYRCYILKKRKSLPLEQRVEINRKLVEWIVKYLRLYQDPYKCYQTDAQDKAAKRLLELAGKIRNSGYRDFSTRIEINN